MVTVILTIMEIRMVITINGDEHCTAPEGVYKHEPSSQGTFQFHVYVYDDVMVYHLEKYAGVNQIPKALVRSMLAFKLPRASRCCPLLRTMVLNLTS